MLKFRIINIIFILLLLLLIAIDWNNHVSVLLYAMLIIAYLLIVVYGVAVISAQFFIPAVCRGSIRSNAIAITFDDGPLPGKTERILKILNDHHVSAAFFCIGERVEIHSGLLKQIHEAGHLIGNHSYSHSPAFDLQSSGKMLTEIAATDTAIQRHLGIRPRFFRPPYGVTNPNLAKAIRKQNCLTVGWSIRSFDTMIKDKQRLFNRVTKNLKAGDIILFHDYCDVTIEILPDFLTYVKHLGLNITRLDEHLNEKGYV